ncbi:MAG: phosphatase PAP2 family protein [Streptomyces sp.]|uniref:phosphatase PAP2 family protein n=1 Tax=Streptomyces sp. TaxID=1931 RepID=UPI003D6B500B
MLFTLITWQIAVDGPLRAADERLGAALRHLAPPGFVAGLCADLGNVTVAVPVLLAAMVHAVTSTGTAGRYRRWLPPLCATAAMAAVALFVPLLKVWLDRPGPLGGIGYYPSGHAATAAVAFGGAALLLCLSVRQRPYWPLLATAAVLTVANGAGLVWRGYHWPLDVLASWCLAWVLLVLGTAAARRGLRSRAAGAGPEDSLEDRPEERLEDRR